MTEATTELLTTNDGRPLKAALATAQARAKRRAPVMTRSHTPPILSTPFSNA